MVSARSQMVAQGGREWAKVVLLLMWQHRRQVETGAQESGIAE